MGMRFKDWVAYYERKKEYLIRKKINWRLKFHRVLAEKKESSKHWDTFHPDFKAKNDSVKALEYVIYEKPEKLNKKIAKKSTRKIAKKAIMSS